MQLQGVLGHGAGGFFADCFDVVTAAGGADRFLLNILVGAEKVRIGRYIGIILFHFQGPNAFGSFDGFKIVNAGRFRCTFAGFGQIGDGDRSQKTNDRNHNHDFHERETGMTKSLHKHKL